MKKPWQPWELSLMKHLYPSNSTRLLARVLNRSEKSIYMQAKEMNIKKDKEHVRQLLSRISKEKPNKGRFQKGIIPWNAGKKGITIGGTQTQFKKGHKPHNTLHDGAITIRHQKNGKYPQIYIRLAQGKWQPLNRYLWQKYNGPIPPGHNVAYKDGNWRNCNIENLFLISNKENMNRNTVHRYPEELKRVSQRQKRLEKIILKLTQNGK